MRIFTPRTQPIHNREQMLTELMRLAREDGLTPDEANMRSVLCRYSLEDIERVVDACERFGVKDIVKSF